MIDLIVPGDASPEVLKQLRLMSLRFGGEHDLAVHVGGRTLRYGPEHRLDGSRACLSALREFGEVTFHREPLTRR